MNVKNDPAPNASQESKRLLSITEAIVYLGVGRNSAIKYLDSIGAKRKIGRRTLYDKVTIDEHLNILDKEVNNNGSE